MYRPSEIQTRNISGDSLIGTDYKGSYKSNYHDQDHDGLPISSIIFF